MKIFKLLLFFFLVISHFTLYSKENRIRFNELEYVFKGSSHWVDSVYSSLSLRDRIAQLFWIAVEIPHVQEKYSLLRKEVEMMKPGGIILYAMESETARDVIDDLQSISTVPLYVSMDGEYGAAMRMTDMRRFPYAITMGAVNDDKLIYRVGLEMAREFRSIGVNVNFAPVLDVNNRDLMPVIGFRAFGEDPVKVMRKSVALMRGMQDGDVMAVGKHFPGHGNTDMDSHYKLPVNDYSLDSLRSIDLVPFQGYISSGGWGLMSAHIEVPALQKGVPASFSSITLISLLRDQMQFKGLLIVDAINMQGANDMGEPGEKDIKALIAGNDIIVMPRDLDTSINAVVHAINNGIIALEDIEEKCRRSLSFKYWLMIRKESQSSFKGSALNQKKSRILYESDNLKEEIYESALTILKGSGFEGLQKSMPKEYACIALGNIETLTNKISNRFGTSVHQLPLSSLFFFQEVLDRLTPNQKAIVIIGLPNWGRSEINTALKNQLIAFTKKSGSIVVFLGNPYQLRYWPNLIDCDNFIMSYENTLESQKALVKLLLGNMQPR